MLVLDLTAFLENPVVEEISLALMAFISIFLVTWLLSKILNFKKQNFKTAFLISIIVAASFFLIRSISWIFSLTDKQKVPINLGSVVLGFVLLRYFVL